MSLLVVGALHWDVVVRAPGMPRIDETLRGSDVAYQFGGKGGNQAIAAARAGASVSFAGRIGGDEPGKEMRLLLERAGVDTSQLQTGPGASGMSVAIVTQTGDYGAVIVSAENHQFDLAQFAIPQGCHAVLLQNEMAPGLITEVGAKARAAGVRVVLNAAPATGIGAADLAAIDTLIVNRVEGADLLGQPELPGDPLAAVRALQALAPHARILLTLGGQGVCFAEPQGEPQHRPADSVQVHSTHGAGDVFVGQYTAACIAGLDLDEAVQAGQTAAATHISQTL